MYSHIDVYNMGIASIAVKKNIELPNKCQITSLNENKQETDESEKNEKLFDGERRKQ